MNATLSPHDRMFATVLKCGKCVSNFSLTGLSSINDALGAVAAGTTGVTGIVSIELRNGTTGWKQRFNFKLSAARA